MYVASEDPINVFQGASWCVAARRLRSASDSQSFAKGVAAAMPRLAYQPTTALSVKQAKPEKLSAGLAVLCCSPSFRIATWIRASALMQH